VSSRQLLLQNFCGFREVAVFDEERPRDLLIKTLQECEPIIERAKMLSELEPGKDFRHVGLIPLSVLDRAHREGWFHDKAKWRQWRNDPDNRKFRTWPGDI
jgi:hypothetical protein